jgi:hypothetical protein
LAYGRPQQLLQQLLALDEAVRLAIAYTLLESVDARVDGDMSDDSASGWTRRSTARSPNLMPARESRPSKSSPRSAPNARLAFAQLADMPIPGSSRSSRPGAFPRSTTNSAPGSAWLVLGFALVVLVRTAR